MLTVPSFAKVSSIKGKSSLGVMENLPPTSCWVETECKRGEICYLSITVTGPPAKKLLQVLKRRLPRDQTLAEWGLDAYVSKDRLLHCDETDRNSPFCTIFFNASETKVDEVKSCE